MFNKLVQWLKKGKTDQRSHSFTWGIMLVGGLAALVAAFTLTVEKFHLYDDPNAVLSCSINVVLNCGTVMQTWQSHVFGFPNMVIGLMAYAVIVTFALAGLSGVKFPRWWLIAANIGVLLGLIFSYWLFFQSVYAIQVLCPWCLIVTTSTTLIFSSLLHYNLKSNTFKLSEKNNARVQRFIKGGYHQMIVTSWIALMVVLVFLKFGQALFA
ncbi:MAG: vitamin K epoxide reductase family protein [Candidatus Saccharimonadales bacterium]